MISTTLKSAPVFALAVAVSATASWSAVAQEKSINVISGPTATGSYVLSEALEQISKNADTSITLNASETPGLVYNARFLTGDDEARATSIMSFTSGINYLATQGMEPFPEALESAMLIANYNLGAVWLATFDEDIKTPEDLVGKRIGLGRPPQILWTIEPMAIIEHGWGLQDDITIEMLGTSEAAQALLNGTVDAAIIGGYANPETGEFLPSPQTVELQATSRTLYHISWGEEAVETTIENSIPVIPATIPAGAVDGLDEPLSAFYDAIGWMAYPDFDEEAAYEIAKMAIENIEVFAEYHALGKLMTPSALVHGWSEDRIHPGALRAYREAGLFD